MMVEELVFEKTKVIALNQAIEELCMTCAGLGKLCNECDVEHSKPAITSLNTGDEDRIQLKEFDLIINQDNNVIEQIYFDKNRVLLTQNAIEDLCVECSGAGTLCFDCKVHELRRTVASLPVIDNMPKFEKKKKSEKSSGGSCGTSCSTGCGTKK